MCIFSMKKFQQRIRDDRIMSATLVYKEII